MENRYVSVIPKSLPDYTGNSIKPQILQWLLRFYYLLKAKLVCKESMIIRFSIGWRGRKDIDFGKNLS